MFFTMTYSSCNQCVNMNGESCTCVYQQQKTSKQSSENTADIVPTGVYRQRKTSKLSAANTVALFLLVCIGNGRQVNYLPQTLLTLFLLVISTAISTSGENLAPCRARVAVVQLYPGCCEIFFRGQRTGKGEATTPFRDEAKGL